MQAADRARLITALRGHVSRLAADLRQQMLEDGPARERARRLHAEERVGDDFDVWTDLLSRRAAVLWVLKTVYVRVLEDRGLLWPGRLLDPEAQHLFERLAPHLGETAFLKWVFRDLAAPRGGLPELFAPQPAEVALPADRLSRELLEFWRHRDPDTNARWSFAEERFEGELMGDLYQELDPVVKERFALCQTPDFVREFLLDRTLTPALQTFGADAVRLVDPACGSGHFLIDGLKRLVEATAAQHPEWERRTLVAHCLDRVVGLDLNDYACALARARLIMTSAELAGLSSLAEAASLRPHVYWADGLEQVEREQAPSRQQLELFDQAAVTPRASLTRPEVRTALAGVLKGGFHAVVANPPYITEKDPARKDYHREKVGKGRRYVSAHREYSLACPFTERCFQLAAPQGFLGLITSNNFMKREFGKPLVEQVLTSCDLTLVVDTSVAAIPHHNTPTVLLFARNRRPQGPTVRAVMGRRGEPVLPENPREGFVWSSIARGWDEPGFENDFVSVADLPRTTLDKHPWSLGGGGAAELKSQLENQAARILKKVAEVGTGAVTREDEVYLVGRTVARRFGTPADQIRPLVEGEAVRDWVTDDPVHAIWPYDPTTLEAVSGNSEEVISRILWPWRSRLAGRVAYGKSQVENGLRWFEYSMFFRDRFRTPLSLAFSFVATHNHFVLDRGGKVFKQSAPIIKLGPQATEADHLALLAVLNSSTACFWMKQVFHDKSGGGGQRKQSDRAKIAYEFTATGLEQFPLPPQSPADREVLVRLAGHLDRLAAERAAALPGVLPEVEDLEPLPAAELRARLAAAEAREQALLRVQVALQEEVDWLCYRLYGLVEDPLPLDPEAVASGTGAPLGCRPFEMRQARSGRETGVDGQPLRREMPPDVDPALRQVWDARARLVEASPQLALVEHESYKRRWLLTPKHLTGRVETFQHRLERRLRRLLADLVEQAARARVRPAPASHLAADLQADPRFLALAELHTGRRDFDPKGLVAGLLAEESVPNHPFHRYSAEGLVKRAAWERTWEDQRREDAGEPVRPQVPPTYAKADFARPEYLEHRGKLDVPRERFVAFTEVPGQAETLYGWAGWTPLQRLKALLALDEDLEDAGVPPADRTGLLDSAWRLLPDVARDDPAAASRLRPEVQALVGPEGLSRERLDDWRRRFPPPGSRRPAGRARGPRNVQEEQV